LFAKKTRLIIEKLFLTLKEEFIMMYEIVKGVIATGTGILAGTGANIVLKGAIDTVVKPGNLSQMENVAVQIFQVVAPSIVSGKIAVEVCESMDTIKDCVVTTKKFRKNKKELKKLQIRLEELELEDVRTMINDLAKSKDEADESAEA
jgi:hypothetical protein